jgi:hypothetical protein
VQNLVQDLSEAVEERIKSAFDLSRIGKDVLTKGAFRFISDLVVCPGLRVRVLGGLNMGRSTLGGFVSGVWRCKRAVLGLTHFRCSPE